MRDMRMRGQRMSPAYSIRLSDIRLSHIGLSCIRLSGTPGASVFSGTVSPERTRDTRGFGLSVPGYVAPAINAACRLCSDLLGRPAKSGCWPK